MDRKVFEYKMRDVAGVSLTKDNIITLWRKPLEVSDFGKNEHTRFDNYKEAMEYEVRPGVTIGDLVDKLTDEAFVAVFD